MFYCVVIVCDWSSISNVDWMIHPRYHPLQQSWNRNIQTVHLIIINGWPRFKCIKEGHIMCMRYHCIVTIVLDTSVLHQPTDNHSLPMTHGLVEYEFYAQCISAYVLPYLRTHLRAWIDQCVPSSCSVFQWWWWWSFVVYFLILKTLVKVTQTQYN